MVHRTSKKKLQRRMDAVDQGPRGWPYELVLPPEEGDKPLVEAGVVTAHQIVVHIHENVGHHGA